MAPEPHDFAVADAELAEDQEAAMELATLDEEDE